MGPDVVIIGSQAFNGCGLVSVNIPDNVVLIDISAFNNNPSLTKVFVGSNVANIGISAFASCGSMTGIYFKGDAPTLGSSAFSSDTATVYHLAWKSGWTSTFGGLATATWNPPVEPVFPAFQTNGFGFSLVGLNNQTVVVEASTNPSGSAWVSISTNYLPTGTSYFNDDKSTNYPSRFYRLITQ
jgi:hypothetical protein